MNDRIIKNKKKEQAKYLIQLLFRKVKNILSEEY